MSEKHPVQYVDLNFRRANPRDELVIARHGKPIEYRVPTPRSLARVARLCRNSQHGKTYPFADGWIWEREER